MDELSALRERAKELDCLYLVNLLASDRSKNPRTLFRELVEVLGEGWQRPHSTGARIEYFGRVYQTTTFSAKSPRLNEPLRMGDVVVGDVSVSDTEAESLPKSEHFLPEEQRLLKAVSGRISEYIEWKHLELLGERVSSGRDNHWRWRQQAVEFLASQLDGQKFGVEGLYLGGSTERGDAGHGSDIDLYCHHIGDASQKRDLRHWLDGWSLATGFFAQNQTGEVFPQGVLSLTWLDEAPDRRRYPGLRKLSLKTPPQER